MHTLIDLAFSDISNSLVSADAVMLLKADYLTPQSERSLAKYEIMIFAPARLIA